jgi:hypothetical protein
MSTLSARDFFLPAAVLGNILLGAYNLNAETKTDEEKTLRWVLAVFQFIIIALALLMTIPKYAKHVFGLIILLSIGAGVSAWYRFKGHEKTRIAFVTAQGLANWLFLLHFGYEGLRYRKEKQARQARIDNEKNQDRERSIRKTIENEKKRLSKLEMINSPTPAEEAEMKDITLNLQLIEEELEDLTTTSKIFLKDIKARQALIDESIDADYESARKKPQSNPRGVGQKDIEVQDI